MVRLRVESNTSNPKGIYICMSCRILCILSGYYLYSLRILCRFLVISQDITLQHLCSKGCVELTEKCARFHILCAYLLCEEEINVFDQKMNHENLTKCLITLKQFYRDLRIEQVHINYSACA